MQFDFDTIRIATDDFSEANKLGQGGFGSVYKVIIHHYLYQLHAKVTISLSSLNTTHLFLIIFFQGRLFNGEDIAVKRLSTNSGQGDLEFKNEVLLVARLQHRNLVRLLGFCLEGIERLLIYEFVPNSSLDHIIFGIYLLQ